jgi:hypothetical protein
MIGDSGEYLAEVGLRIQAIQLGRSDQTVERGGALAAGVGTREQKILPSQGHRAQGAFHGLVDFDASVLAISRQRSPARERVSDGRRKIRLPRSLAGGLAEPLLEVLEQRCCACLTLCLALCRRSTSDILFDFVQRTDALERLQRNW